MKERFAEKEELEISKPNGADFITDDPFWPELPGSKKDAEKAKSLRGMLTVLNFLSWWLHQTKL